MAKTVTVLEEVWMMAHVAQRGLVAALLTGSVLGIPARAGEREAESRPAAAQENTHWAFRRVQRPAAPAVRDRAWVRTPIDAFVLSRLERAGLAPAGRADRRALLRRVYLDLVGMPPTPQEQQAFLRDPSPGAFEKVVDRLLARPEYGERWGRHWLDVVRYAESNGYERDGTKPNAWRYRDYVINALNQDKPYDRFLTEQLAGDELPDSSAETQIATTFLRLGTWDDEPADPLVDRYDQLDDVLGTAATAFLAVTLRCARCHDHKFEPFPQSDYYSLLAVFEPLKRPQNNRVELDRLAGTQTELTAYQRLLDRSTGRIAAIEKQIEAVKGSVRARLLSEAGRKQTRLSPAAIAAFQALPARRSTEQKDLVKQFSRQLETEIRQAETAVETTRRECCEKELAALRAAQPPEPPRAYVWYEDNPRPPVTRIFRRGDPTRPREAVSPAIPAVLTSRQPDPPRALTKSTGRRLWLARWLASPDNPLVARVIVNRIWQHHFGRGLVPTENDFGVMGQPPSHPELLDWLASELVEGGWRLKRIHRLILLSSVYQMASSPSTRNPAEVALLPCWPQHRLEAEAVRDSILAVSGRLNTQKGGPSVYPTLPQAVLDGQSKPGDGWGKSHPEQAARRSVYIFVKRSLAVPELDLLDAPDTTSSCERRVVSTTGPQALTFLNGEFINSQARHFAARLLREAGGEHSAQVQRAFELALCRPPSAKELTMAAAFLSRQQRQVEEDAARAGQGKVDGQRRALEAFCLVLLNTNEFVYHP
jgi:hypothetical protein